VVVSYYMVSQPRRQLERADIYCFPLTDVVKKFQSQMNIFRKARCLNKVNREYWYKLHTTT